MWYLASLRILFYHLPLSLTLQHTRNDVYLAPERTNRNILFPRSLPSLYVPFFIR